MNSGETEDSVISIDNETNNYLKSEQIINFHESPEKHHLQKDEPPLLEPKAKTTEISIKNKKVYKTPMEKRKVI